VNKQRILIVGGGTGGTMLANILDKRRFAVTLVTASLDHLFQPALLYVALANAPPNIVRDERRLLAGHVRLAKDPVAWVDLQSRVVRTAGGTRYDYDKIVIATGVTSDPSQIPGLSEINARFGDYHTSITQAQRLWASLEAFAGGTIALGQSTPVIKCPPSPIEGILLVDRLLRRRGLREKSKLVFFTPFPRAYSTEPMNEVLEPVLKARGIEVRTFFDVDKIDPEARKIVSIEGESIDYDLPIVIPPFTGTGIEYDPPRVLDADRFVKTDKATLQVVGFDTAFALGDATDIPTSKAGVGAHLEAKIVAERITGLPATFNGRTHCPIDLGDGRGAFIIGSFKAPVRKYLPSRLAHAMKAIMAKIYWLSLRGAFEPVFDWYFARTDPEKARGR
jgi:sulfide:quinone oxidoreductase